MAYKYEDKDTGVTHIMNANSVSTLCGLQPGWTRQGATPDKEKYGITCEDCQLEIKEIKELTPHP